MATRAPLSISDLAIPYPMPLLPPVTSATAFFRFMNPPWVPAKDSVYRNARSGSVTMERTRRSISVFRRLAVD